MARDTRHIKAKGFNRARKQMLALSQLEAAYTGVYLPGHRRDEGGTGISNGEVIDYLADGGRDIRANERDVDKCARAFVTVVELGLMKVRDQPKKMQLQKARQLAAKAWRAAGMAMKAIMLERVESGTDNTGGAARALTGDYIDFKNRKYGQAAIYKATGQLVSNLAQGPGALRLSRGK